jgi:hypothetical protein
MVSAMPAGRVPRERRRVTAEAVKPPITRPETPIPIGNCPVCALYPFRPKRRGKVQRGPWWKFRSGWRAWLQGTRWPRYALICSRCGTIAAYEDETGQTFEWHRPQ